MSTKLSIVPSEAVPSVGNAWIICRSKSYAGRIYYFNTSTGETVWNLTEPEILKAKAMTKIFKCQSGFQPEDCPEPGHSPKDDISHGFSKRTDNKYHNITPAKIYNKQVINNQYSKPYASQLPNFEVSNGIQLNIPVTPTFNSLWNIAPQPIFVAPAPVHQHQHFSHFDQVPITSTAVSLSNRFKNVSSKGPQNKVKLRGCKRTFHPKVNNKGPRKTYFKRKLQNNRNNLDLRLLISSRRTSFNNIDFTPPSGSSFANKRNANIYKNTLRENNYKMIHDDDMWLEENLQSQGKGDKLDATPLKSYFQIENSHLWYIIADSDALLNNVNFLNILLNSDEQCRLLVPQVVMNIIEKAKTVQTSSRLRTPAHRAAYFISQQVDANLAIIVPHIDDSEGSTDEKLCIITCCANLMNEDIYVIILTDSMELNVLKDTGEMPILTITEIKELLRLSNNCNETGSTKTPKVVDSCNIKITISNTNKTPPISPITKTDEAKDVSELTVTKNITNNVISSNTELIANNLKRLNRSPSNENVIKKRKLVKKGSQKKKKSLDISMKSTSTCTKTSNFGSSAEPLDKVENDSGNSIRNSEKISKKSNKSGEITKDRTEDIECNVMFEVTSQAMEEYLKVKSDEWVSRFIQIMEEVLAQILQQEPKFVLEALPPPWTVYESTECIKRKFIFDCDIVDAATKLLNVLFELGGLRGKIKNDLTPEKYMEMYSFGVYLIDALQGLLNNSEDLETAAESLSKLLSDIQNPHLDPCNQDSFADGHLEGEQNPQDKKEINADSVASETENVEESVNIENHKMVNTPSTPIRDENSTPDSSKIYNLRSNREKNIQDKEDVVFIRHLDIGSSFFSSLETRTNADKGIFRKILSNDTQNEKQHILENNDLISDVNAEDNDVSNKREPTFIRKITKCIEFEEKLKENSEVQYDSWTHRNEVYEDYEELDYESMEEGYYMDGEYQYNEDMYESDDLDDDIDEKLKHSDDLESQGLQNDNNNIDYKLFVQKLQDNIKGSYSAVHEFCKKSYEKLSSTDIHLDKCDILLAEKAYLFIENLCSTFNRILERETSDSEHKLQQVFKNKEFEGVVTTGRDLEDYRCFISNCLTQGNVLKESVRLIIAASREA